MNWHNDGMKQFTGYHKHSTAYEVKQKFGDNKFHSYFKFVFVKNPFDLLVSLYFYLLQSKNHLHHQAVIKMEFNSFLKWHINNAPPLQMDYLADGKKNRRLLVDYIGRFETLSDDISVISTELT